jgi:hypothetical protein
MWISAASAAYLISVVPGAATPAGHPARQAPAPPAQAFPAAAPAPKPDADLLHLMRGMMYPESNVVFASQYDVGNLPLVDQPAISPNPLTSAFGGWQAVENNALALAESAQLLLTPGRVCSNGKPVPVDKPDWVRFTLRMHDTALQAHRAAQTKSTDAMLDATAAIAEACQACHNVYRSDRPPGRCVAATPAPRPTRPPA